MSAITSAPTETEFRDAAAKLVKYIQSGRSRPLTETPVKQAGIYALFDHEGIARYVGISSNLKHRINSNHVNGDDNSHKFSQIYNVGRLKDKKLRTSFVRAHCRANWVALNWERRDLRALEKRVLQELQEVNRIWNDTQSFRYDEPTEALDQFLAS